jgi:hypothetical protein
LSPLALLKENGTDDDGGGFCSCRSPNEDDKAEPKVPKLVPVVAPKGTVGGGPEEKAKPELAPACGGDLDCRRA